MTKLLSFNSLSLAILSTLALARFPCCAEEPGTLVLSVRSWEGEYFSKDIPGGVESSPSKGTIYTIRADGSSLVKAVDLGNDANAAAFSADGKWLYFQAKTAAGHQIFRCRPDGAEREQITSAERLGAPWKNAYGTQVTSSGQILCAVSDGTSARVGLLSPDDGKVRVVAPHLGYLYMSALSPRGDAVICSGPASGYRLWLFKLPEAFGQGESKVKGPAVNLAPDHPDSYAPQCTPDGKSIIYFRRDGDIYRVEADGTGHKRLTTGNKYVEFRLSSEDRHGSTDGPHLSPDGKQVAYIALRNGVPNVCVVSIDGGEARQVTFRKTPCGRVKWSPSGKQLSFVSFEGKFPQLFVVEAAGGEPKQVTKLEAAVYFANWKP